MKRVQFFTLCLCALSTLVLTGCRRNADTVWEDTRSAGRHVNRGFKTLGGKHGDSRQVRNRDEFMNSYNDQNSFASNGAGDYIPLQDYQNSDELAMADYGSQQPREMPGEAGSSIPGIEAFQDPSLNPRLASIFKNISFGYNSSLIKGEESLETIKRVSEYMRQHPNTYVFVEGHCDNRGPEAYNLALGSHRSNAVRNLLIQEGVSPDNIFTISYGKERPLAFGADEACWGLNRRAEFKVYER